MAIEDIMSEWKEMESKGSIETKTKEEGVVLEGVGLYYVYVVRIN